jgi:lipopolysaccharide/colanic/teichoic acid biosynthesis glycosyltransferase
MKPTWKLLRGLPGRLVALLILISLAPALFVIWLLLRTNTDEPVFQKQELQTADRGIVMSYRFRTAGRGGVAFLAIGSCLRRYSLDEFPALWSVLAGELRLGDILHSFRTK